MGGKADDICIVFSFTTLTFLKFLFYECFIAFSSLIRLIKSDEI